MKKEILLKNLKENKAEAFKSLFVRDILTSKDNDKISFHYCRMEPQGEIANDRHECIEVYYFLTGEGKAKVGGDTFQVSPGSIICADSNEYHSVINTGKKDLEFLAILSPPYA
jgi:mannose-6-phosphate isomerase-like protein (cupin superfamily)